MYINSCYINRFSYLVELLLLHFLFVSHLHYLFPFVVVMIDEIVKYIIYFLIFRLTFQFSPSSKVYGFSEVDLVRNGGDQVCVEKTGDEIKNVGLFSPLHPNFTLHILHTVLYTFPNVLTRRICLTIKSFFSWWSFSLFSWPSCLIQRVNCREKWDVSHC